MPRWAAEGCQQSPPRSRRFREERRAPLFAAFLFTDLLTRQRAQSGKKHRDRFISITSSCRRSAAATAADCF
jgi:hypothetical protein